MFDQTVHGGKIRDESDESDSDDESVEGFHVPEPAAPTPLPSRTVPSMMAPIGHMVPPTPTPAPGFVTQNRPFPIAVNDENDVPVAVASNIFSETPARTPLVSRTPMGESSSKPRAFAVLEDVSETPAPIRQQLATNVFATPAVQAKPSRGVPLGGAIIEESEDADPADIQPEEYIVNVNDEEDEDELQARLQGGRYGREFYAMTPITERTGEYTTFNTLRSSQMTGSSAHSGIHGITAGLRRTSIRSEASAELAAPLTAVAEVEEPSSRSVREETPDLGPPVADISISPESVVRHSGSMGAGEFSMPDGFTIHGPGNRTSMNLQTMVFVDGDEARRSTGSTTAAPPVPNPCSPIDEDVFAGLMATLTPSLESLPGFVDHRGTVSDRLGALQKHAKSRHRRASTSRSSMAASEDFALTLGDKEFEIWDKIGEGGFGAGLSRGGRCGSSGARRSGRRGRGRR